MFKKDAYHKMWQIFKTVTKFFNGFIGFNSVQLFKNIFSDSNTNTYLKIKIEIYFQ